MTGLCLAAGALLTRLAVTSFMLAWTHSIEKVRWEENWRIDGAALVLDEARIQGSGAGMEPPEGAVLDGGSWHYHPAVGAVPEVVLARSRDVPDWQLCHAGSCAALGSHLPGVPVDAAITLRACERH